MTFANGFRSEEESFAHDDIGVFFFMERERERKKKGVGPRRNSFYRLGDLDPPATLKISSSQ
jgi:hypothetical protein